MNWGNILFEGILHAPACQKLIKRGRMLCCVINVTVYLQQWRAASLLHHLHQEKSLLCKTLSGHRAQVSVVKHTELFFSLQSQLKLFYAAVCWSTCLITVVLLCSANNGLWVIVKKKFIIFSCNYLVIIFKKKNLLAFWKCESYKKNRVPGIQVLLAVLP